MKFHVNSSNIRKNISALVMFLLLVASVMLVVKSLYIRNFAEQESPFFDIDATENAEGKPVLDLFAHNIIYGDGIHIAYAIELNLPDGVSPQNLKMSFWNFNTDSYLADSPASYVLSIDNYSGILESGVTVLGKERNSVVYQ